MILPSYRVNSGPEIETGQIRLPVMTFCCKDIGMDCSFESRGSTEPGILRDFIHHAESSHNLDVLPADLLLKIKDAIKKDSFS
jgi:predicted small metal-binding protein